MTDALDTQQRAVLATYGERRQAQRGEHLPEQDTRSEALYLVTAGVLRHYRVSRDGAEVTLSTTGGGGAFFFLVDAGGGSGERLP